MRSGACPNQEPNSKRRIPWGRRRGATTLVASVSIALAGCESPTTPSLQHPSVVDAQWVTPEVRAALDPAGRFSPPSVPVGLYPVTESRAVALATAYVFLTEGPQGSAAYRQELERLHQGPIDWGQLRQCGRVTLVNPVYASPPAGGDYGNLSESWPGFFQRAEAAQWVIAFCGRASDEQLTIGVSTEATDVEIRDRYPQFPLHSGGEFIVWGVLRLYDGDGMHVTPEHAVQLAFAATQRRIASLPQAVRRGNALGYTSIPAEAQSPTRGACTRTVRTT